MGLVIFFTGFSGSGKTTLAEDIKSRLESEELKVTLLDGDIVREHLSKGLGFSKEDRNLNIERIGFVASEIARHGGYCICSAIAPYEESRKTTRVLVEAAGGKFVLVWLKTPISECQKRDPKGLYKKVAEGKLNGFTGIDDLYEDPKDADIILDTSELSVEKCVEKIFETILGLYTKS